MSGVAVLALLLPLFCPAVLRSADEHRTPPGPIPAAPIGVIGEDARDTWDRWSASTLERAGALGRPVLLLLVDPDHPSAARLETTFEEPGVTRSLRTTVHPVRLDRADRPGVWVILHRAAGLLEESFSQGCALLVLTPEGMPWAHIPPEVEFGASLSRILAIWREDPAAAAARGRQIVTRVQAWLDTGRRSSATAPRHQPAGSSSADGPPVSVDPVPPISFLGGARDRLLSTFDPRYGGITETPRFLPTSELAFALAAHRREPGADLLWFIVRTLDALGEGGLDPDGGGFLHVASEDLEMRRPWPGRAPGPSSRLAVAYLRTHEITGHSRFRDRARGILDEIRSRVPSWVRAASESTRIDQQTETAPATEVAGLALSALEVGARSLGDEAYGDAAIALADWIHDHRRDADGVVRSRTTRWSVPATLGDLAAYGHGLLELARREPEGPWSDRAGRVAGRLLTGFQDEERGAFFLTASGVPDVPLRSRNVHEDGRGPSSQAEAIRFLARMASRTGDERFRTAARRGLDAFHLDLERIYMDRRIPYGLFRALDTFHGPAPSQDAPEAAPPTARVEQGPFGVALHLARTRAPPGARFPYHVVLEIDPGWLLPAVSARMDPTRIEPVGPEGTRHVSQKSPPAGVIHVRTDAEGLPVYMGSVTFEGQLAVDQDAPAGPHSGVLEIRTRPFHPGATTAVVEIELPFNLEIDPEAPAETELPARFREPQPEPEPSPRAVPPPQTPYEALFGGGGN